MENETDWKTATIILICLVLILASILIYSKVGSYEVGNIKLKKSTINDIKEVVGNDFKICDIKNNCVTFRSLDG